MSLRKGNYFIAAGSFALAVGIVLQHWPHNYVHFASGFLLGISIVLLIGGLMKQSRGRSR